MRHSHRSTPSRWAVALCCLALLTACTSQDATGPNGRIDQSSTRPVTPPEPATQQAISSTGGPTTRATPTSTPTTPPATSRATKIRPTTTRQSPDGSTCVGDRCYTVGAVEQLPVGVAPESSGIVASTRRPGTYFVVDDGTGADQIVAVDSRGGLVAKIGVQQLSAGNAEALAAGTCGSRAGRCFYIGDIGDNDAKRKHISIYRIDEPSLSPAPRSPVPSNRWDYTYPDGPHNAEALMVAADGSLVVITKSAPDPTTGIVPPHRIYRATPGGGELTYLSSFTPPEPAKRLQSMLTGTVVTDATYADGRVLLLTYDEVVEYVAPNAGAALSSFPTWPHHELPDPIMIQSEGITFQAAGCGYQTTSEEGPDGTQAGMAGVACS